MANRYNPGATQEGESVVCEDDCINYSDLPARNPRCIANKHASTLPGRPCPCPLEKDTLLNMTAEDPVAFSNKVQVEGTGEGCNEVKFRTFEL